MKLFHILRTYPGGVAAATKAYTVKLHDDDSTLDSGNTDADGAISYNPNLSPGPVYVTGTDTVPDPDAIRVVSTKTSGGGGAYSLAELPIPLRMLGNGVIDGYLNELAVTYDAAGLDLDVNTGAAIALGIPAVIHTAAAPSVTTTRDATHPKACYLVLEFTGVGEAEEGKVELVDVCGTAAASPALPALTQTDALWQEPLATFQLPNTGSTTLTSVVDARTILSTDRNPTVSDIERRTDPDTATTTTSTTGATISGLSGGPTLISGVTYDVTAETDVLLKAGAGQTVSLAVFINGTGNLSAYIESDEADDYIGVGNAHSLEVSGTGAAISCGARWKVSGGTGSALTGTLLVTAIPRS